MIARISPPPSSQQACLTLLSVTEDPLAHSPVRSASRFFRRILTLHLFISWPVHESRRVLDLPVSDCLAHSKMAPPETPTPASANTDWKPRWISSVHRTLTVSPESQIQDAVGPSPRMLVDAGGDP